MSKIPAYPLPRPAVGFSLGYGLADNRRLSWEQSHERVLNLFPWLQRYDINLGATTLRLWGHYDPQLATHRSANGDLIVLVGSTLDSLSWAAAEPQLRALGEAGDRLPWEGRCAAIRISADGTRWEVWSDWVGGMPVYYADGVASSLEPVAVATAELGPDQMSRRGLIELLMLGQFLGTDTLYEPLRYITPDAHTVWERGRHGGERKLWSVVGSEANYGRNPAQLIEEWQALHVAAVAGPLESDNSQIAITLSSGMDSRVIACVLTDESKRTGRPLRAFTYGPAESLDVTLARRVADSLGLAWERIPIGQRYMADHMPRWLEWFGTSLHAHGMYQFAFLSTIAGRRYMLPTGNLGNAIGGGGQPPDEFFDQSKSLLDRYRASYTVYWPKEQVHEVLTFDPQPYFDEIEDVLQAQYDSVRDWPIYARMNIVNIWNRIGRSIFYQPMMYSYYGLERQPFTYRPMARFALALEPELHRKRNLQLQMMERFWPQVMDIPAPPYHKHMRGLAMKWHALRFHTARRLPPAYRPLLGPTRLNIKDLDCAQKMKWAAFPPLSPDLADLEPLRSERVVRAAQESFSGEYNDVMRVLAALPVVARLSGRSQLMPA